MHAGPRAKLGSIRICNPIFFPHQRTSPPNGHSYHLSMLRSVLQTTWQKRNSIILPFALGIAGAIFFNDNVCEAQFIIGKSMQPTLSPEFDETGRRDLVLVNKFLAPGPLKRGDVVHFMNPMKPDNFAIKRVIALEGDTVVLDKKRRPRVTEGPEPPDAVAWDAYKGRVKVPQGHIWVEGDNFRASRDSNWYGPISKSLVNGTATAVIWPPSRFWTKPWVGFEGRTKVIEGRVKKDWTEEGLPVELSEIGEPHLR